MNEALRKVLKRLGFQSFRCARILLTGIETNGMNASYEWWI
jgi:DNA-directed RNA polymerase subunit N (RpoN/RPB10)